jgi:hypothetical protein
VLVKNLAVVAVAAAFLVVACHIDETHVEDVVIELPQASAFVTCTSPFTKPDLDSLPKCGDEEHGAGHCYDGTKVPIAAEQMTACPGGGMCVPDAVLSAGGKKTKSCTFSFNGQPGACVSMLMKDVHANKDFLKQDGCADDERCLPCIDPRDGRDTTLCAETGAHESACTGGHGEAPTLCCHWRGECIEKDAVPANVQSTMIKDTCPGTKLCAPIAQVEAKPVICEVLGGRGVCLDRCFLGSMAETLTRSNCSATERCMPCALANTFGGDQRMVGCE